MYQSFCEIMGLDSSETRPLVVTLLNGLKDYRGSGGSAVAPVGSIHITPLIYLEIGSFSRTKLHLFLNSHR